MWELAIFIGGMVVGVVVTYGIVHPQRVELERLKTQDRILLNTVADNYLDLEELRKEIDDLKTQMDGQFEELQGRSIGVKMAKAIQKREGEEI